jgi:ubiquinone/menaquinone biosynthesis C-methylase UbiE
MSHPAPWYGDVIDMDRIHVGAEEVGAASLLLARHLPADEAATADERFHDREAAVYDSYCDVPRVAATEGWIVPWIRRHSLPGVTVDLGCGTGRVAKALVDGPGRRVIAVDRSLPMLEVARSQMPPLDVVLLRADARALPIGDRSVDTVVCSGVLHHLPAWSEAVTEAARVLRPGGRLIVREPNTAYPAWLFAPLEHALERVVRCGRAQTDGTAGAGGESMSPVERPLGLPALRRSAERVGLRPLQIGSAMLLGSLGVPDEVPIQQLYFWPANLVDRFLLRFTRHRFGALLLAVFTAHPDG